MSKTVLSRTDLIKVNDLLRVHLHQAEHDADLWVYEIGWDDGTIAKSIHPKYNANHVATARKDLYGNLYIPPKSEQQNSPRINVMAATIGKLVQKHNDLVALLVAHSCISPEDGNKVNIIIVGQSPLDPQE